MQDKLIVSSLIVSVVMLSTALPTLTQQQQQSTRVTVHSSTCKFIKDP